MHSGSHRYKSASAEDYMHRSRQVQEQLHQILTQMSGFALMLLTRRVQSSLCAGPLDMAERRMKAVREEFRALLPVDGSASHHHHHLGEATAAIERCVGFAYDCLRANSAGNDKDNLTRMLRTALDHLQATARLLPGFAMIDLCQSCCAAHLAPAGTKFIATAA